VSLLSFIPLIGPIIEKIVDRVLPGDSEEARLRKIEIEAGIIKELSAMNLGQLEINKVEAASDSLFKSGWRPTVAWMGVFGLGWSIFNPLISYGLVSQGLDPLPTFQSNELITILMALLGMGGYRTYEKYKGIIRP